MSKFQLRSMFPILVLVLLVAFSHLAFADTPAPAPTEDPGADWMALGLFVVGACGIGVFRRFRR